MNINKKNFIMVFVLFISYTNSQELKNEQYSKLLLAIKGDSLEYADSTAQTDTSTTTTTLVTTTTTEDLKDYEDEDPALTNRETVLAIILPIAACFFLVGFIFILLKCRNDKNKKLSASMNKLRTPSTQNIAQPRASEDQSPYLPKTPSNSSFPNTINFNASNHNENPRTNVQFKESQGRMREETNTAFNNDYEDDEKDDSFDDEEIVADDVMKF